MFFLNTLRVEQSLTWVCVCVTVCDSKWIVSKVLGVTQFIITNTDPNSYVINKNLNLYKPFVQIICIVSPALVSLI